MNFTEKWIKKLESCNCSAGLAPYETPAFTPIVTKLKYKNIGPDGEYIDNDEYVEKECQYLKIPTR